jgi:NAD-dependent SIR2 family protein deacetylase
MPQRVSCQKCGHILYEGEELKPPDEIIQANDGKCPKCGKKLSYIPIDIEVKPAPKD